jgi:glycosyltransferase involved in cell wall biosynthesis
MNRNYEADELSGVYAHDGRSSQILYGNKRRRIYKAMSMIKLSSLFPIYVNNQGVTHTFLSINRHMQRPDLQVRMVVPNCERSLRGSNIVEAVPSLLKKLYYRSANAPTGIAQKRFLKDLKDFDAAYLWPATSVGTFKAVKQLDKPIFLERFNCYTGKAKRLLDEAYQRLGVQPQHIITFDHILNEQAEVQLADFIFCPSPEVKKSFQELGICEDKLILTSYGWSPQRFPNLPADKPHRDQITVLFVGNICVRKGAHLLLRAWERAGIKGRLMLCGRMEPVIAETCDSILKRPDVVHVKYNSNVAFTYHEADLFAFPSLEEGSPLVAYEAMAHGLPMLTSPMGAGGVVRDGIDGMIVSPYDEDAWVEALRKLAHSPDLRAKFGVSARKRAKEFTWEKVAQRRAALVQQKLNPQLVTSVRQQDNLTLTF